VKRPFAKLMLKPAVTWRGAVAADLGRLKATTAGAALQSHALPPSEVPAGKQALPSRFVFERKRDGRYKARLLVGGHRQQHGLDFAETFAPVCSYRTMRMLLEVSAHENLVLRQFNVRTAFLNGELEEEVYLRPPSGAEHLSGGHK
jgi:hypothetical protein